MTPRHDWPSRKRSRNSEALPQCLRHRRRQLAPLPVPAGHDDHAVRLGILRQLRRIGEFREIDDPTVAAMAALLIALSVVLVVVMDRVLGLDRFLDAS